MWAVIIYVFLDGRQIRILWLRWMAWVSWGEFIPWKQYHLPEGGVCYAGKRPRMVGVPLSSLAQISCKRLKPLRKLLDFSGTENKLPNKQTIFNYIAVKNSMFEFIHPLKRSCIWSFYDIMFSPRGSPPSVTFTMIFYTWHQLHCFPIHIWDIFKQQNPSSCITKKSYPQTMLTWMRTILTSIVSVIKSLSKFERLTFIL